MNFNPGDIILVRSGNWFGSLILWFMKLTDKDGVYFSHAAIIESNSLILQSKYTIEEVSISEAFKEWKHYKVIRYNNLKSDDALKMVNVGKTLLGLPYGIPRFITYLLDKLFDTHKFSDKLTDSNDQICSSFVAYLYDTVLGYKFNNISWESCDPDDIDDMVASNPGDWTVICEVKKR